MKKELFEKFPLVKDVYDTAISMKNYMASVVSCRIANRKNKELSEDKILRFKGIHQGERCFIIGSGPSLKIEDVEILKDEWTFGVNADFMLYDKTKWRANYYTIIDDTCVQKYADCIDESLLEAFFYGSWSTYQGEKGVCLPVHNANNHVIFTIWNKLFPKLFPVARFSDDIGKIVYTGKSVVYTTLQIAVYMGFKEIYLLGVDCNYRQGNMYGQGINHIDKFTKEHKHQNGDMMIPQYEVAQQWAEKHDVQIYNVTRGGMLEAFPRKSLEEIFN